MIVTGAVSNNGLRMRELAEGGYIERAEPVVLIGDCDPVAMNTWGRLAEVTWGSCTSTKASRSYTEEYSYDTAGDVAAKRLSIWKGGQCSGTPTQITASFSYDSEGKLTSTVYPSVTGGSANTTAVNTYDSMSRLQGVSTTENLPSSGPCNDSFNGSVAWASDAAYTVSSQIASLTRFSGVYQSPSCVDNFLTANEFFKYNVNNQLADIETSVSKAGGLSLQNPQMDGSNYILAGYTYSATQNNGQIASMQDGREGYSVTYQYDLLKRLVSATGGSTWTQTFGYDGFGNLISKSTPSGSSESPLPGANPAKNWLTGYTYDQNGNVGSFNNFALNYDPANRLSYVTTGSFLESYTYDSANHRIERINSSLDTVYFFSPSGKLLSMFNCLSTCTLISNRVYFGGVLLGTDGTSGQGVTLDGNFDTFTWTDRLGSAQPTYPYGTDIGTPPAGDAPDFATYSKEGSTGLEYGMNRYFSGGLGRFMTTDPSSASAQPDAPQSWNRYSYVEGDPVNFNDPLGADESWVGSGWCVVGEGEYAEWTECDYYTSSWALPEPPPPGGGGGGSAFPKCNPGDNAGTERKLNYLFANYDAAASEASTIQGQIASETGPSVQVNQSNLTLAFLYWGADESGYGVAAQAQAENNFFGAQQGIQGSIPCVTGGAIPLNTTNACFASTMGFGAQLSNDLGVVPHTVGNPNPGDASYVSFIEAAMIANPNLSPAYILQTIANAGWNASKIYGGQITRGIAGFPELIDCLTTNYGLH